MDKYKKSIVSNITTNYVTAIYMRLSLRDRNINKNDKVESDSISNQRALIRNYIKNSSDLRGCEILEFCDDGHTGANLNRPAFQAMLKKANEGAVQCIIVKDFSRFARDHIEVGIMLSNGFPVWALDSSQFATDSTARISMELRRI